MRDSEGDSFFYIGDILRNNFDILDILIPEVLKSVFELN